MESGSWYEAAVNWASANDIVNGCSEEAFGPTDAITREQLAAILYRYAAYKGKDVSGQTELSQFTDAGSVSDWAQEAMAWAVNAELINGMSETTLVPQGSATRAQAATLMMRLCEIRRYFLPDTQKAETQTIKAKTARNRGENPWFRAVVDHRSE